MALVKKRTRTATGAKRKTTVAKKAPTEKKATPKARPKHVTKPSRNKAAKVEELTGIKKKRTYKRRKQQRVVDAETRARIADEYQVEVNWEQIRVLAALHCTQDEITAVTGHGETTLTQCCKRDHGILFREFLQQNRGSGKVSLRRRQYRAAMDGDKTMMVWLGKNWLRQTDKVQVLQETTVRNVDGFSRLTPSELELFHSLRAKMDGKDPLFEDDDPDDA